MMDARLMIDGTMDLPRLEMMEAAKSHTTQLASFLKAKFIESNDQNKPKVDVKVYEPGYDDGDGRGDGDV